MTQSRSAELTDDAEKIADKVVRTLVELGDGFTYADLAPSTVHAAKRCLLDAVGCAVHAVDSDLAEPLHRLAATVTSPTPASVIGTKVKSSPDMAGFVNGSLIRCLDFNDDYFGTSTSRAKGDTGPHPSDNIGSVMATAEMVGGSGQDALLAIVTAYEVCGRLVDEVVLRANGWDHPILHSISTAVAAGQLMKLERSQLANAIRLATVSNVCLYETRFGAISNWKGMAGPNGSRNGLFAAQVAGVGITGPEMAFEGHRGFMRQLGHDFTLQGFEGARTDFRIDHTYFKQRPLRYEMQLPVQLALDLRHRLDPRTIRRLQVFMEKKSVTSRDLEPELWRPMDRETADHSGPYLIAAALLDGEVDERAFSAERLNDPRIHTLIDTIELLEDPSYTEAFPGRMSCRFEIELTDGQRVVDQGDHPRGHPTNPMSDAELEGKFTDQVEPRLGRAGAQRLLELIWTLDQEATLTKYFDMVT